MNIKTTDCVYPSYHAIQTNLQKRYLKKYQQRVASLKQHLQQLQLKHNFRQDHQLIQNSILALSTQNPHHNTQEKPALKPRHQPKGSCLSSYHGESLNYYIEDDGEEESNYETYLKFKKKTLQRDLQEQTISRMGSKRRQKEEEELLFRKLYFSGQSKEVSNKKKGSSLKVMKGGQARAGFSYKGLKQNSGTFLKRVQKNKIKLSERDELVSKESKKDADKESQVAAYERNRKLLTDNYLDILKKLEGSNIVKWRVLNTDIVNG